MARSQPPDRRSRRRPCRIGRRTARRLQMLTVASVIVVVGLLNDGTMLPLALMQIALLVAAVIGFRLTYGPIPKAT